MRIYFSTCPLIRSTHLVLKLEHLAKMRRDLREEIDEAGGLEKLNRHYIDGIYHALDAMEEAMINAKR